MSIHVVVPAAGTGSRFGASTPKQYQLLEARPVLQHTLDRLSAAFSGAAIHVVLAHDDRWFDGMITCAHHVRAMRCGGATRAATVRNAVRALDCTSKDWVAVHDAVRPCLPLAAAQRLVDELVEHPVGGLLAVPLSDTVKRVDDTSHVVATPSRQGLWRAQTPQMFRLHVLANALELAGAEESTDEAEAVERLGLKPRVVLGSTSNLKITVAEDMQLAAAILAAQRCEGR